jgi:succinate dehydrogenase / fumarate reductase flavoprotein subunit
MQGLSDGYFILPYTVGDYIARSKLEKLGTGHPEFARAEAGVAELTRRLLSIQGNRTVDWFHRGSGKSCGTIAACRVRRPVWNPRSGGFGSCGRNTGRTLKCGQRGRFESIARESRARGGFLRAGGIDVRGCAPDRNESCGGHFREEYQTGEGEAQRNDDAFCYVGAWEYQGPDREPVLHKEPLTFEYVHPSQRSYK